MNQMSVAEQTWKWMQSSGRVGAEAIQIVNEMGLTSFLDEANSKWEAAGRPRFMEGMKQIMYQMIWS